ncbi:MarR family winged helix-turn-helix transcriptional regulator [Neotabrizicola sp. sgz301269]|uniref:MarR family winged helix-turn-helix transcriptional regulator n=1 Tax=Neotabrizicola sp. sgz301269 TaxID=3276282 RepID=UPI00377000ED
MTEATLPTETVHDVRDRCLCLATNRAARILARRFDRLFAPLGLTNGQFSLMVALCGAWRPRLGELAEFLAMDTSTMTAAAKTLQRRGLILFEIDQEDARARRPQLTQEGRDLVAKAVPIWRQEHARLEADLASAADLRRSMGALQESGSSPPDGV